MLFEWEIVDWLQVSNGSVEFSQFTVDWIEAKLDAYRNALEDGLLDEYNFTSGIIYEARNILQIMRDDIPDVELFKKIVLNFDYEE